MPTFNHKVKKIINGFDVSLYEVNLGDTGQLNKLQDYIRLKIKSMKAHKSQSFLTKYMTAPNIKKEFSDKLEQRIKEINTPVTHAKSWFDVRRGRVTEFMSQLLLEREFNCIFHDETDKRINTDPVNIDKHAPGIDVTGIHSAGKSIKFVVCEVKASKDHKIPCSSASDLLDDIKNSYSNRNERLTREILDYAEKLSQVSTDNKLIEDIINFLVSLIRDSDSQTTLLKNVVFFPFLIRNHSNIVSHSNLDDFIHFKKSDLKGISLQGIIWSFNHDIDSFCNDLYDEVLASV